MNTSGPTQVSPSNSLVPKALIITIILLVVILGWLLFWVTGETIPLSAFVRQSFSANSQIAWQYSRVLGVVAYVLFWLSVMTGLMIGSKNANTWFARGTALSWHQFFSSTALGVAGIHAGVLYFDNYLSPSVYELMVPFALQGLTGAKQIFVGVGQLALYLSLVIVIGYSAKRLIPQNIWRYLHAFALLSYVGMVVHGVYAGTDSQSIWLGWLYFFSNAILAVVLIYRLLQIKDK